MIVKVSANLLNIYKGVTQWHYLGIKRCLIKTMMGN